MRTPRGGGARQGPNPAQRGRHGPVHHGPTEPPRRPGAVVQAVSKMLLEQEARPRPALKHLDPKVQHLQRSVTSAPPCPPLPPQPPARLPVCKLQHVKNTATPARKQRGERWLGRGSACCFGPAVLARKSVNRATIASGASLELPTTAPAHHVPPPRPALRPVTRLARARWQAVSSWPPLWPSTPCWRPPPPPRRQ